MLYNEKIFEVRHKDGTPWTEVQICEYVQRHCREIPQGNPPYHFELSDTEGLYLSDALRHMEYVSDDDMAVSYEAPGL